MLSAFGVEHGEISKAYAHLVPNNKEEKRKSRARGAAQGGAVGGIGSGAATYALNGGKNGAGKAGLMMTGVGGAIGAGLGATGKKHNKKIVLSNNPPRRVQ